jgi:hypothetical protein
VDFFILILVFMGNRLIWANKTGFKVSTLSGNHCSHQGTKYHSIAAHIFLNQAVGGFFFHKKRPGVRNDWLLKF